MKKKLINYIEVTLCFSFFLTKIDGDMSFVSWVLFLIVFVEFNSNHGEVLYESSQE